MIALHATASRTRLRRAFRGNLSSSDAWRLGFDDFTHQLRLTHLEDPLHLVRQVALPRILIKGCLRGWLEASGPLTPIEVNAADHPRGGRMLRAASTCSRSSIASGSRSPRGAA